MKGIMENIWGNNNWGFSNIKKKVEVQHRYLVPSRVNNSKFILWCILNCRTRMKRKYGKLPERINNYADRRYHVSKIDARRQWNKIFKVKRKSNC